MEFPIDVLIHRLGMDFQAHAHFGDIEMSFVYIENHRAPLNPKMLMNSLLTDPILRLCDLIRKIFILLNEFQR